jgi:hypothetical protein
MLVCAMPGVASIEALKPYLAKMFVDIFSEKYSERCYVNSGVVGKT